MLCVWSKSINQTKLIIKEPNWAAFSYQKNKQAEWKGNKDYTD